jgi:hypothetical protein
LKSANEKHAASTAYRRKMVHAAIVRRRVLAWTL